MFAEVFIKALMSCSSSLPFPEDWPDAEHDIILLTPSSRYLCSAFMEEEIETLMD